MVTGSSQFPWQVKVDGYYWNSSQYRAIALKLAKDAKTKKPESKVELWGPKEILEIK